MWSTIPYTAKNATDLLQFYQLVATCQQVAISSSISSSCNKPVDNKFEQSTCNKSVDKRNHANASWYRLVVISLLQDVNRLVATCSFLAVWWTFGKLLDNVNRDILWATLKSFKLNAQLVTVLQAM